MRAPVRGRPGPGAADGHARPVLTFQSAAATGEQQEQQEGEQRRRRRGGPRAGRGHGGGGAGGPAGQSRARRHARLLSPPRHARALAAPPPPPLLSRAGRGLSANHPAPGNPAPLATASAAPIGRCCSGGRSLRGKMNWRGRALPGAPPRGPAPWRGRRRAGSAPHPAAARGTGLLKGPRSRPAPQSLGPRCPVPRPSGCG